MSKANEWLDKVEKEEECSQLENELNKQKKDLSPYKTNYKL